MQTLPTLTPDAQKILEIVFASTAIDGSTLMKQLDKKPEEIVAPIRELQKHRLVEVGGRLTPDGIAFARIGLLPSTRGYVGDLLQSS